MPFIPPVDEPTALPCSNPAECQAIEEMIARATVDSPYHYDPAWATWVYDVFTHNTQIDAGTIIRVAGYTRDMHRAWVATQRPDLGLGTYPLAHPGPKWDGNLVQVISKG